ncbi:MAG: hypothetical protein ACOCVG_03330 [Verrucomicrobiota bacterium]
MIEDKGVPLRPLYDSAADHFAGEAQMGSQTSYISGRSVDELREGLMDAVDFYESRMATRHGACGG